MGEMDFRILNIDTIGFGVATPPNETKQEKTKRHDRNFARFAEWAVTNDYSVQISFPRSGRQWISDVMYILTGKLSVMSYEINHSSYEKFLLHTTHGWRMNYIDLMKLNPLIKVVMLVRDPRDCLLSNAYRSIRLGIPDYGYREISTKVIAASLDNMLKYWQATYEKFLGFNHIVIQYEHLCLAPEKTFQKILDFLEVQNTCPILNAVMLTDRQKMRTNGKETATHRSYPDGAARYANSCLKWKDDKYWLPEFNDQVCEIAGDYMVQFGYTKDGHDLNRWRSLLSLSMAKGEPAVDMTEVAYCLA